MQIAVLSDSHDQIDNLNKAIEYVESKGIETMLFCGDFTSPIPVKQCFSKFKGHIHAVFGNTEDRHTITKLALTEVKNLEIHGEHAELEFDGKKIAMTHYPFYAEALAKTGDYDAVFHGHTHEAREEKINDCLLVNPGEIMGRFEDPGFGIYDTENNSFEFIKLKDLN